MNENVKKALRLKIVSSDLQFDTIVCYFIRPEGWSRPAGRHSSALQDTYEIGERQKQIMFLK